VELELDALRQAVVVAAAEADTLRSSIVTLNEQHVGYTAAPVAVVVAVVIAAVIAAVIAVRCLWCSVASTV
jgi:hypothetical protein